MSATNLTWIGMGPYQCLRGARHGGEKVERHSYVSLSLCGGEWSDIGAGELGWGDCEGSSSRLTYVRLIGSFEG